jgi:hypothetical protein
MDDPRRPASEKEAYETPRVRKVKLVPDELAVGACKKQQVAPQFCNKGGIIVNRDIGS